MSNMLNELDEEIREEGRDRSKSSNINLCIVSIGLRTDNWRGYKQNILYYSHRSDNSWYCI